MLLAQDSIEMYLNYCNIIVRFKKKNPKPKFCLFIFAIKRGGDIKYNAEA